jgi:hypothetical protein
MGCRTQLFYIPAGLHQNKHPHFSSSQSNLLQITLHSSIKILNIHKSHHEPNHGRTMGVRILRGETWTPIFWIIHPEQIMDVQEFGVIWCPGIWCRQNLQLSGIKLMFFKSNGLQAL